MSKKKPSLTLALGAGVAGLASMPIAADVVFPMGAAVSATVGITLMFVSVWMTYLASE